MGTGKMAGVMAGTVKKMKNVKCYGVASRTEERAQEFANEYGVKVAYTSYEEMLLDSKIDYNGTTGFVKSEFFTR